jgi:hypothetical protein
MPFGMDMSLVAAGWMCLAAWRAPSGLLLVSSAWSLGILLEVLASRIQVRDPSTAGEYLRMAKNVPETSKFQFACTVHLALLLPVQVSCTLKISTVLGGCVTLYTPSGWSKKDRKLRAKKSSKSHLIPNDPYFMESTKL